MSLMAAFQGFGIGASLIVAIGAQNAFVLTSALRHQHVWAVAATCILIDVLLILAGVWGLGALIEAHPTLLNLALWGGALFLFIYGGLAFKRAWQPNSLQLAQTSTVAPQSLAAALLTVAALSLLNPHVYLDTVILLGSIGGQLPGDQPAWFAVGACLASLCWFSLLAWGGKKLAPWFASPKSWQRLDILIGVIMWAIALGLILKP